MRTRWANTAVATLLLIAATACTGDDDSGEGEQSSARPGGPATSASGHFGGELEGTDALIGVAASEERVTVYVCDDGEVAEWFISDTPSDEMTLGSSGGATAELQLGEDEATGSITLPNGSVHEFRAARQEQPTIRRAEAVAPDHSTLAGWVTVGNRTTGALSTTPTGGSRTISSAPPLPEGDGLQSVSLPIGSSSLLSTVVTLSGDATFVTANRPQTFVIGGIGDSYASGEGNPPIEPSSPVSEPTNLDDMWGPEFGENGCHRSDDAGTPQAFFDLDDKYPGFDFRLAFVACGGSHVTHVTGRPPGAAPPATGIAWGSGRRGDEVGERTDRWQAIDERPQLEQLNTEVGTFGTALPVDVLTMSIGGNDSGFATVVGACVMGGTPANIDGIDPAATIVGLQDPKECDENPELIQAVTGGPDSDNPFRRTVPGWTEIGRRYDALDATLEAFSARHRAIGQVLITQYGAGLKNTTGSAYCGGRTAGTRNDIAGFIDVDETQWIEDNLLDQLNLAVSGAVTRANDGVGPNWKAVTGHVSRFLNHGPCSSDPWTHINATALAAQGNNLPGKPDDGSRDGLAQLNTVVAALKGAAIGCGIGAVVVLLNLAGCAAGGAAGAVAGLIVGLATNESESAVSAGMMHPNRNGWDAVGDALLPEVDAAFQRTFTPPAPTRMRQFGATENGSIVVRWDDRSSTETRYEVEWFTATNPSTPVSRRTNLAANAVTNTFRTTSPFVGTVRARACNAVFCSPFSARLKVTNLRPRVPTGLSALTYTNQQLAADLPDTLVVMATDPRNADTSTRIELRQLTDASGTAVRATTRVFNVPAPFASVFTFGGPNGLARGRYRVRAASCNIFGCSGFTAARDSSAAPPGPPDLELDLLPPFIVDRLGLTRPRTGINLPDLGEPPLPGTSLPDPEG